MSRNYLVLDGHRTGEDQDAASVASSMDLDGEVGGSVTTRKSLISKPPTFSGRRVELPIF